MSCIISTIVVSPDSPNLLTGREKDSFAIGQPEYIVQAEKLRLGVVNRSAACLLTLSFCSDSSFRTENISRPPLLKVTVSWHLSQVITIQCPGVSDNFGMTG